MYSIFCHKNSGEYIFFAWISCQMLCSCLWSRFFWWNMFTQSFRLSSLSLSRISCAVKDPNCWRISPIDAVFGFMIAWRCEGIMTKAKSRIRFCCWSQAKEFRGIFTYSGVMKICFQSIMDAVMKYKWVDSWKDGKVTIIPALFASLTKAFT